MDPSPASPKGTPPPHFLNLCFSHFQADTVRQRWEYNSSHLDSILDFPSVVSDDEGRLHDSGELDVTVSFVLTLELVQQGLIGRLRETKETVILSGPGSGLTVIGDTHTHTLTFYTVTNMFLQLL